MFVGDTWVIQQQAIKKCFLNHVNSIDPSIKFNVEGNQENRVIPFLDTFVKPMADNSLSIRVYCKPTHTEQYLQWDSHHSLSAKYNVIGTLTNRVKSVCTTTGLLDEELQHLKEALVRCKYPRWAINKVQNKVINDNQGLGEGIKCFKYGIRTHFKGNRTLKQILVAQRLGPRRQEEWCYLLLPVFSHRLWRGVYWRNS